MKIVCGRGTLTHPPHWPHPGCQIERKLSGRIRYPFKLYKASPWKEQVGHNFSDLQISCFASVWSFAQKAFNLSHLIKQNEKNCQRKSGCKTFGKIVCIISIITFGFLLFICFPIQIKEKYSTRMCFSDTGYFWCVLSPACVSTYIFTPSEDVRRRCQRQEVCREMIKSRAGQKSSRQIESRPIDRRLLIRRDIDRNLPSLLGRENPEVRNRKGIEGGLWELTFFFRNK